MTWHCGRHLSISASLETARVMCSCGPLGEHRSASSRHNTIASSEPNGAPAHAIGLLATLQGVDRRFVVPIALGMIGRSAGLSILRWIGYTTISC